MRFKSEFKDNTVMSIFIAVVLGIIIMNILYPFTVNIWLSLLLGLFASFFILNHFYSTRVAKNLEVNFTIDAVRHYKSQDGVLYLKVTQPGWIPLLNAELRVTASDHLKFHNSFESNKTHQTETRVKFSTLGNKDTLVALPYTANKRGLGKIIDVEIFVPQPFGFDDIKLVRLNRPKIEIMVYPDKMKAKRDDMRSKMLQGFIHSNQSLFDDPMQMVGVKDYNPQDSMKRIHWKASAKGDSLKSKVYENVTQMSWMILVNLRSHDHYSPPEYIEDIFEKLAYLTEEATKQGISYSLMTNMSTFDKSNYFKLHESYGSKHYKNTLEALARINSLTYTIPYEQFLKDVIHREQVPTHVITCGHVNDESYRLLNQLAQKGAFIYQLNTEGIHRLSRVSGGAVNEA